MVQPLLIPLSILVAPAWVFRYFLLVDVAAPEKDRSHWTIRKFSSFEEQRRQQLRDWQRLSGAERRKAAWELVTDYWIGMKGMDPDELRLQRSVTYLGRGEG